MKKIAFLSFGHWTPSPQSQTRSAADTLLQSIDLAVETEPTSAFITSHSNWHRRSLCLRRWVPGRERLKSALQ